MTVLRVFLFAGVLACVTNGEGIAQPSNAPPGVGRKDAPAAANQSTAQSGRAAPAPAFPNGASSINETYGDWTVNCRMVEGQKKCLVLQAQGNSQTKQRIYEIELLTAKDGRTDGSILMPLGVKLEDGALMSLDDKDLDNRLRFSTCTTAGCLLPVSFTTGTVDAMKKGKSLTIASLDLNSAEVIAFKISLEGFSPAIARLSELSR